MFLKPIVSVNATMQVERGGDIGNGGIPKRVIQAIRKAAC